MCYNMYTYVTIVTCIVTYLKAEVAKRQGHILTCDLKVHILGCTKFGKLCKFNTVDSKN